SPISTAPRPSAGSTSLRPSPTARLPTTCAARRKGDGTYETLCLLSKFRAGTEGDDFADAYAQAKEALGLALLTYSARGLPLRKPKAPGADLKPVRGRARDRGQVRPRKAVARAPAKKASSRPVILNASVKSAR